MKILSALRAVAHWIPALAVVLLGLVITRSLVEQQQAAQLDLARAHFADEVRASSNAIARSITAYSEVTAGLRDLFLLDPELSYEQFSRILENHDVRRSYPEISDLSFVREVREVWLDETDDSAVATDGSSLPRAQGARHVLEYLWPSAGREPMLGLVIRPQSAALVSVLAARESGATTVSTPLQLTSDRGPSKGFLLRQPIFIERGQGAAAERHFLGAVGAFIDAKEMLESLQALGFMHELVLRIEDAGAVSGTSPNERPVLLATTASWPQQIGAEPIVYRELTVHDRRWRLSFLPATSLLSRSEQQLPYWISAGGVLLSLLFGVMVSLLGSRHRRALHEVRNTHRALQQSEDRFGALFNQAAVGMSITDAHDGRLLRVNRKYAEILGYSKETLLQFGVQNLIHPQDLRFDEPELVAFRNGVMEEYHAEKRMRHHDGHWVWAELTVSPVRYEDGGLAWHATVLQDVTARREMEDALRDRVARLRNIFDHLPVAVVWIDADLRIVFRNKRFIAISGYDEQQVPDVASWWSWAYPNPALRKRAKQSWQRALQQAQQGDGRIPEDEYDICCGDGALRTVLISGVLLGEEQLIFAEDLSPGREAEREINYLAYFDPLTGLPNRRYLLDRLPQINAGSARRERYGALLMLDLDHFKMINETRGHECGDELLYQVAGRLRAHTHKGGVLARHGDDEFVVVLEDLADSEPEAVARAEQIGLQLLEALRQPYQFEGWIHHATVSMGVSLFNGARETADELLRRADLAMNQAKSAGRIRCASTIRRCRSR